MSVYLQDPTNVQLKRNSPFPPSRYTLVALIFGAIFFACVGGAKPASAKEITLSDSLPLTRTPWVQVLSVPQFDPSEGVLQQVRLSFTTRLRGEGYYENRAEVSSTISFQHKGIHSLIFANGDELSTINTLAQSSLLAPQYDGVGGFNIIGPLPQDDEERLKTLFNGTSGGLSVATNTVSAGYVFTTAVDLKRFIGLGEFSLFASAEAQSQVSDTTGNVDYELRSFADAQLVVHYDYVTTATIDLQKTVYAGHDSGASCPGKEKVEDEIGKPITYCFLVTNMGDSYLNQITISDTTLGISDLQMTLISGTQPLAPGATLLYYNEQSLTKELVNEATVEGIPSDATGTPIDGLPHPTDSDTAEVITTPRAMDETDEPKAPDKRVFLPLVTR